MPILWFEQHVEMSEAIASEIKMILELPHMGVLMGVLFIVIGLVHIIFIPMKNLISQCCCTQRRKIVDLDKNIKVNPEDSGLPEISPLLITKKPQILA